MSLTGMAFSTSPDARPDSWTRSMSEKNLAPRTVRMSSTSSMATDDATIDDGQTAFGSRPSDVDLPGFQINGLNTKDKGSSRGLRIAEYVKFMEDRMLEL